MSGLSDADREALGSTRTLVEAVERIVDNATTRAVNAALIEAADAIKAVPAMYGSDIYLQALTRAECIVRARVRGESA